MRRSPPALCRSHRHRLKGSRGRHPSEQVVIRVRPPLPRELQAVHRYENTVAVDAGERVVTLSENLASLQGASNPAGTASVDNGVARTASLSPIPLRSM